jgi:hypothetical protein
LNLHETDDHRRVLAVITFLKARRAWTASDTGTLQRLFMLQVREASRLVCVRLAAGGHFR